MKNNFHTALGVIALAISFSGGVAFAEDAKPVTAQEHEQHHPAEQGKDAAPMGDQGGMMGKMDMSHMHDMMKDCKSMHKDGKMCDHEMMEKCEKEMGKGDCQKMMKQAKAKTKTKVKK